MSNTAAEKPSIHTARVIGLLFMFLIAGCAKLEHTPPESNEPPKTSSADTSATAAESPGVIAPARLPAPSAPVASARKKEASLPPNRATPNAKAPAKAPAPPIAEAPPQKKETPPLDLTALETRLKETKAIGVFTKLTLKNQVDDLLNQFRAYYQGQAKITLTELRQPYDRLLLKVLTLLQDGDPELARAIVASREAIWSILADPAKFATL
jgi:hypothetical protein